MRAPVAIALRRSALRVGHAITDMDGPIRAPCCAQRCIIWPGWKDGKSIESLVHALRIKSNVLRMLGRTSWSSKGRRKRRVSADADEFHSTNLGARKRRTRMKAVSGPSPAEPVCTARHRITIGRLPLWGYRRGHWLLRVR
jgi:hypothetical protein